MKTLLLILSLTASITIAHAEKVKVFILSGQSNMTGRGNLGNTAKPPKDQPATLFHHINLPENKKKFSFLTSGPKKTKTGWTLRDDVFITMGEWPRLTEGQKGYNRKIEIYKKHGPLGPFYGGRGNRGFGPELAIGHLLGKHYKEKVVLIKVAYGNNSLFGNFRPPRSGGKLGDKYPKLIEIIRQSLEQLPVIMGSDKKKIDYEIVGLFWNQGLSDCQTPAADQYEGHLVNLIEDIKKEFKLPQLKTVIGLTGNWGFKPHETLVKWGSSDKQRLEMIVNLKKVQQAQINISKKSEYKGKVLTAETRDFWRPREKHGGHGTETHWMANGETYWLIGESMANSMLKLLP